MTRSAQTVVKRKCKRLRGLLHLQRVILENLERANSPSAPEIAKVRDSIQITLRKLQDLGCNSAEMGG
jgi:hypothetical protein